MTDREQQASDMLQDIAKDIQEKLSSFKLKDGSVLSQLFNGTLVFEGRQDSAAAFKEFRTLWSESRHISPSLYSTATVRRAS